MEQQIDFQNNLQPEEKLNAETKAIETNKKNGKKHEKKKLSKFEKWSNTFLTFTIIGVVYLVAYSFIGLVALIPALFLWLFWLVFVLIATIFTVGLIWLNDEYKQINQSFIDFNTKIGDASITITEFLYKIFPYTAAFFGIMSALFVTFSIIGLKKMKEKHKAYKTQLVWSIILFVLCVAAVIFDAQVYISL